MSATAFVDVSLTDGQSAIWSGRLATPMLLGAVGRLGTAGLAAIEALNAAVIDQCLARGEHPLRRLTAMRRRVGSTPLRVAVNLIPAHGVYDRLEGDALANWLRLLAKHGATEVVFIDPLMDMDKLGAALQIARGIPLQTTVALLYAERGCDDAIYKEQARKLVAAGAQRIMLRDESGTLHVERLTELLPLLQAVLEETPLDLHTRCQTGLAPQVVLEAVRLGVARIDTALPCVAHGPSLPPLPLLVRSAGLLGLAVQAPNRAALDDAQMQLSAVADQEGFAQALPWAFDLAPYIHQLPGEAAAAATRILQREGRMADLHAFAHECERIREEVGAPPMQQPFAAGIAEQALAHLRAPVRYTTLRPVLRRVLQGAYGRFGATNAELQRRVGCIQTPRQLPAHVQQNDDALLMLIAGRHSSGVTSGQALDYEIVPPAQALVRGLLKRWPTWAALSVNGPGVSVQLDQSKG